MDCAWTTADELSFLDALGAFSLERRPRAELLRGYIEAALRRADWGQMDPGVVLAKAIRERIKACSDI